MAVHHSGRRAPTATHSREEASPSSAAEQMGTCLCLPPLRLGSLPAPVCGHRTALWPLADLLLCHTRQHRQPIIAASFNFFFRSLSFNKVTQKVTAVTLPAIVIYKWGLPTNEPVMFPLVAAQCPCSPFCARLHVLSVPYLCLMNRPLNWQAANGCCAFCICRSTGSETLPRISY